MKRLKITTMEKEFRTVWVEVEDEIFEDLRVDTKVGDEKEVLKWAQDLIDNAEVATELSSFTEPEVVFVDQEDGDPLYEG